VFHAPRFHRFEPARLAIGIARRMRIAQLVMHQRLQFAEIALDHRCKALLLQPEDLLLRHCHTSLETATTRSSLRHCSSAVSLLPWCVLEKPHCGDRQRFSSAT